MDYPDNNPLVTAVITTHNRKDLVLNAITSVQNQTYSNLEIIVVDDHSTDGTKEIIEKYINGTSICYIYNTDDLGGNHIRNIGIMAAKGDCVAFLDDDDEWFPEKIERQVAFIRQNPRVGAVFCGRIMVWDSGERRKSDLSLLPNGDYSQKIFKGCFFSTSCFFVKKELLLQCNMFDESLKYWQEFELYMRLAQITQFGSVMDHLVLFRCASVKGSTKRLSYNLSGWPDAVDYVNQKHNEKIKQLPEDILKKYKLYIANDGCRRSVRAGNKKELHRYLKELYQINPNFINLTGLLINHYISSLNIKKRIFFMFKNR